MPGIYIRSGEVEKVMAALSMYEDHYYKKYDEDVKKNGRNADDGNRIAAWDTYAIRDRIKKNMEGKRK